MDKDFRFGEGNYKGGCFGLSRDIMRGAAAQNRRERFPENLKRASSTPLSGAADFAAGRPSQRPF